MRPGQRQQPCEESCEHQKQQSGPRFGDEQTGKEKCTHGDRNNKLGQSAHKVKWANAQLFQLETCGALGLARDALSAWAKRASATCAAR